MGKLIPIIKSLLASGIDSPTSVSVNDVDREYKSARRVITRAGKATEIGTARDRSKKLLWFFRRKNS